MRRAPRGFRAVTSVLTVLLAAGCAGARTSGPPLAQASCEMVVSNQTPLALEVRLQVRELSTVSIGALNPGELLTHSLPCEPERVWIAGVEIPWQVGARPRFGVLYAFADLVEGERAQVALHWP